MKIENVTNMGMQLERWTHKSCTADFGTGEEINEKWAVLYHIESGSKRNSHATELLTEAKKHYESLGMLFGSSVALNQTMRNILVKLGIKEYM